MTDDRATVRAQDPSKAPSVTDVPYRERERSVSLERMEEPGAPVYGTEEDAREDGVNRFEPAPEQ